MSNEGNIEKRIVSVRLEIELCKKVETGFRRPSDMDSTQCFIRALEEATRDIRLTVEQYEEIAAEARANHEKRMAARAKKNGGKNV